MELLLQQDKAATTPNTCVTTGKGLPEQQAVL